MHLPTLWVYHPAAEGGAQGHYSLMEVVRGVVSNGSGNITLIVQH